jgi:hypothetical protein
MSWLVSYAEFGMTHLEHGNTHELRILIPSVSVSSSWKAPSGCPDMLFLSGPR